MQDQQYAPFLLCTAHMLRKYCSGTSPSHYQIWCPCHNWESLVKEAKQVKICVFIACAATCKFLYLTHNFSERGYGTTSFCTITAQICFFISGHNSQIYQDIKNPNRHAYKKSHQVRGAHIFGASDVTYGHLQTTCIILAKQMATHFTFGNSPDYWPTEQLAWLLAKT